MQNDPQGSFREKCSNGDKPPNSGNLLKLIVPSRSLKTISVLINIWGKVTSRKMSENEMENRGSKSGFILNLNSVKEQQVYGSWYIKKRLMYLRYTLVNFGRNYHLKIPSKQLIVKKLSTLKSSPINPWFLTGLIDAEGSFHIHIRILGVRPPAADPQNALSGHREPDSIYRVLLSVPPSTCPSAPFVGTAPGHFTSEGGPLKKNCNVIISYNFLSPPLLKNCAACHKR